VSTTIFYIAIGYISEALMPSLALLRVETARYGALAEELKASLPTSTMRP
jgi:hypothetical protein